MGNAAPPSWYHIGRQSLLLNYQLAGLFRRLPSIGPGRSFDALPLMASGNRRLIPNILEARPTWHFLLDQRLGWRHSLHCPSASSGHTTNVRHTFTGTLQMMTDSLFGFSPPPRNNYPLPLPLCVFGLSTPTCFPFRAFSPFRTCLPACGEV
jgi:hypothetical protein